MIDLRDDLKWQLIAPFVDVIGECHGDTMAQHLFRQLFVLVKFDRSVAVIGQDIGIERSVRRDQRRLAMKEHPILPRR